MTTLFIIIISLLAFACAVVLLMEITAVDSPESDPERDGGRSEAAITADAERSAGAVISPESSRLLPNRVVAVHSWQNPSERYRAPAHPWGTVLTPHRVCKWCQLVLQEGIGPTTHGICGPCAAKMVAEMERDWAAAHPHTTQRHAIATL